MLEKYRGILVGIIILFLTVSLFGQTETSSTPNSASEQPAVANLNLPYLNQEPQTEEHPLVPVLKWAKTGRPKIAELKDYTALLTKQETVSGEKQAAQMMELKVRHKPFSVYLKFRWPRDLAGQEVIYVKGQNDDNMWAHGIGLQKKLGTLSLDPNGLIAMRGNKYPITEIGLLNLVDKLVEVGEKDVKYGECSVNYYEDIKSSEGRPCTMIEVVHPVPRKNFIFYVARILVDNEYNMPIRYESYEWATEKDPELPLIEIYEYQKLRLNVGLTDEDFDIKNSKYDFP